MTTSRNEYFPQSRLGPGATLEEKLEEMGMSAAEFADYTGETENTIKAVFVGKCSITPDMAAKFENVTRIPVHWWLNSQRNYDRFMTAKNRKKPVEEPVFA
ncbi:MAG: HigA family addiction module antidote protein [Tannerella sp.]|jgi:addiction module HigA family antidote|nr:HigA family addiction module antidote protein [Tannerella sp.]